MQPINLTVAITQLFGFSPDKPATLYINSVEPYTERTLRDSTGTDENNPAVYDEVEKLKVSTQLVQEIDGGNVMENRTRIMPKELLSLFNGYDPIKGVPTINMRGLSAVLTPFNVSIPE